MTFEDIKKIYVPKPEWELCLFISKETGNYVAIVFQKIVVNRFKKETTSAARGNISTKDLDKYLEFILPYLDKRQTV